MEEMKNGNSRKVLLIAGMIFFSGSFIIARYITLSDAINGFLKGFAIGLLLLALLVPKFKKNSL